MNEKTAAYLLSQYPWLWLRSEYTRELILNKYHCSSDYTEDRHSNGSHADMTATRAIKLSKLSVKVPLIRLVELTGKWIDSKMDPNDRKILLHIWRLQTLPNYPSLDYRDVVRWWNMQTDLTRYLVLFAGLASGGPGTACVSGHSENLTV